MLVTITELDTHFECVQRVIYYRVSHILVMCGYEGRSWSHFDVQVP